MKRKLGRLIRQVNNNTIFDDNISEYILDTINFNGLGEKQLFTKKLIQKYQKEKGIKNTIAMIQACIKEVKNVN